VEDGRGLEDPHDAPCLEERVPTPRIEIPDHLSSNSEEQTDDDDDDDGDDDQEETAY
jgi:hypothetical protein